MADSGGQVAEVRPATLGELREVRRLMGLAPVDLVGADGCAAYVGERWRPLWEPGGAGYEAVLGAESCEAQLLGMVPGYGTMGLLFDTLVGPGAEEWTTTDAADVNAVEPVDLDLVLECAAALNVPDSFGGLLMGAGAYLVAEEGRGVWRVTTTDPHEPGRPRRPAIQLVAGRAWAVEVMLCDGRPLDLAALDALETDPIVPAELAGQPIVPTVAMHLYDKGGWFGELAYGRAAPTGASRTAIGHEVVRYPVDKLTHSLSSITLGDPVAPNGAGGGGSYATLNLSSPRAPRAEANVSLHPVEANSAAQMFATSLDVTGLAGQLSEWDVSVLQACASVYQKVGTNVVVQLDDVLEEMGFNGRSGDIRDLMARSLCKLAMTYTDIDWSGATRYRTLGSDARRNPHYREPALSIGFETEGSDGPMTGIYFKAEPANLYFARQLGNQIATFPAEHLRYGLGSAGHEGRQGTKKQVLLRLLAERLHEKKKATEEDRECGYRTEQIRLTRSAENPERKTILELAGVNVANRKSKKYYTDLILRALADYEADGTAIGHEVVREGRAIARVDVRMPLKRGR